MSTDSDDDSDIPWYYSRLEEWGESGLIIDALEDFLSTDSATSSERLQRAEYLVDLSVNLRHRLTSIIDNWDDEDVTLALGWQDDLKNPMAADRILIEYQNWAKENRPWELELEAGALQWATNGLGDIRKELLERFDSLDSSNRPATIVIVPYLANPDNYDLIKMELGEIEQIEEKQNQLITDSMKHMLEVGYDVVYISELNLKDALDEIDKWYLLHDEHEQLRLLIIREIAPFDNSLADHHEARRIVLIEEGLSADIQNLSDQIIAIADNLHQRQQLLNDQLKNWRNIGIILPSEEDATAEELLEWEANLPEINSMINIHLNAMQSWQDIVSRWPERKHEGEALAGKIEHTQDFIDIVESLQHDWRQIELDGLELVAKYEDMGLVMDDWQRRVVDKPRESLQLLKAEIPKLDIRLQLIDNLNSLDSSYDGSAEVEKRISILREIDADAELLTNMELFIDKQARRGARHLRMLERDWLDLLGQGKADENISTSTLNIRAFEELIASTRRFGKSASASPTAGDIIAGETMKRLATKTDQELAELEYRGWNVTHLRLEVNINLVAAARKISNMRTQIHQHPSLCRRLKALPWQNDVALALDTELELRKPDNIENLHNSIPQFLRHLASRPIEDSDFTFTSWSPSPIRQTLVPMVSKDGKEVLLPRDGLQDVHEAILEAMEEETIAKQEVVEEKVVVPVVKEKIVEKTVSEEIIKVESRSNKIPNAANAQQVDNALVALSTLLTNLGLKEDAELVQKEGAESLNSIRRNLASHVGIEPRDMRVDRILRLAIRLIPRHEKGDDARAELLTQLSSAVTEMSKWSRLRLEARHSGASGNFLDDAITLGIALERIPGPGISLPLMADQLELPHPTELVELEEGVNHVVNSIRLPPVGGVRI
ncbi:hypothetical protein OAM96_04110 [Candidatus Poseidoniaceae archaeon]|nr:hypothetical protein [Candidatus Poseidoniaceae archaeon]